MTVRQQEKHVQDVRHSAATLSNGPLAVKTRYPAGVACNTWKSLTGDQCPESMVPLYKTWSAARMGNQYIQSGKSERCQTMPCLLWSKITPKTVNSADKITPMCALMLPFAN